MISTTPSVAEMNAAINVLTILEMAKDAKSMKEAMASLKAEQDKLDEARAANTKELEVIAGAQQFLEEERARVDAEKAKLVEANRIHIRNNEDLAADRALMKAERERFDNWMAEQREELDRVKARVSSDASANSKRTAELDAKAEEMAKRERELAGLEAAAKAKIAEYQQKLDALKQMVS